MEPGSDRPSIHASDTRSRQPSNAEQVALLPQPIIAPMPGNALGRIALGGGGTLALRQASLSQLHQRVGNRATAALVRRLAGGETTTPADIAAQEAFNPGNIVNNLVRAIDSSQINFKPWQRAEPKRHINFAAVVQALSGLTPEQGRIVKEAYRAKEGRPLYRDLFEGGESGFQSDLNENQRLQIHALLAGTRAAEGATVDEQQAVAVRRASAQAAQVRELLKGKPSKAKVEEVMAILRQSKEANAALIAAYTRLGGRLYVDLARTDQSARADLLLEGRVVEADALKVSSTQKRLEEVNAAIAKLEALQAPKELTLENLFSRQSDIDRMMNEMKLKELRKEHKTLVGSIEATGQQAVAEAQAEGGDVSARVRAVYGDVSALQAAVGEKNAPVIKGLVDNRPAMLIAAEIRRAAQDGKLTGVQLTSALRRLRSEAEKQAERTLPGASEEAVRAEASRIADEYFRELRSTYDQLKGDKADAKSFDDLINETGNEGDEKLNQRLWIEAGKLSDLEELVRALRGSRKDTATVERILRNKSAAQIETLKEQYQETTGRSLETDLFGRADLAKFGNNAWVRSQLGDAAGKATGTMRINLEDYMQRPSKEDGPEEVLYIYSRAKREYEYALENGGFVGAVRDAFGNEERKLLNYTFNNLKVQLLLYRRLVGWDPGSNTVLHPEAVDSPEARSIIQQMRLDRHTIRGDRAAYEEATEKLRQSFQAVASFVLQAALSALLTPAAAALFRVAKVGAQAVALGNRVRQFVATATAGTAATIGTTVAVTGQYSLAKFKNDLISGFTGPLASAAAARVLAAKMFEPVAKGLVAKLGPKATNELHEFAKNAASEVVTADDLSVQGLIESHILGRGGEVIGAGVTKVAGLDAPAPGGPTDTATPGGGDAAPVDTTTPAAGTAPVPVGGGDTGGAVAPVPLPTAGDAAAATTAPTPVSAGDGPSADVPANPAGGESAAPGGAAPAKPTGGDGGGGGSVSAKPEFGGYEHNSERAAEVVAAQQGNGTMVVIKNRSELEARFRALGRGPLDPRAKLWYENHDGKIVIVVDGERVPGAALAKSGEDQAPAKRPVGPDLGSAGPGGGEGDPFEGRSWFPANPENSGEALQLYTRLRTDDPAREFALIYNHQEGKWAVISGGPNTVRIDPVLARLGWNRRDTVVGRHSHPAGKLAGILAELTHLPSGRGFDLDVVRSDSYKGPPADGNQWHTIDIMVEGKPDRTHVSYSRETGKWTVDYPDKSERGGRGKREFSTTEDYHVWFKQRFGIEVRHQPRGGAPETLPADELTLETDIERLARLREQVDDLVQGRGVLPGPLGRGQAEHAQQQVAGAQAALKGDTGNLAVREASVLTIIEQSVAATRAMHVARGETLTGDRLRGFCGDHRDVTADSILSLVGQSAVPIVVERVQMSGIMPGSDHSFVLVRLPGGKTYLVDTSFAQFFRQPPGGHGQPPPGSGMLARPEGAGAAARLIRDGMMELTPESSRDYVLGLGATEDNAGSLGSRLLAGEASFIVDIVQNGQIERMSSNDAGDRESLDNVLTPGGRDGSVDEVRRIMSNLEPGDERLPLLEDLAARLEALNQRPKPVPVGD